MTTDVSEFEEAFGNPLMKWFLLKERVQQEHLKRFSDAAQDLLDVLWCLDQYKIHDIAPRLMGNPSDSNVARLSGAYRMKGNWFADLVSLLLINQTSSPLASRSNIQGFSQTHQIDIAWPAQHEVPLVCVETKVMGGPPVRKTTARAATADWSNRRKELKFQATDLKLYRRQQATQIDHWDNWRKVAAPSVYFLWCARMKKGKDRLDKMVREVRALTETYLDGAGIFAYQANKANSAYEVVPIPWPDRVVHLDDLVHRIANQINDIAPDGAPPVVEGPPEPVVDLSLLEPDNDEADPDAHVSQSGLQP